MTHFCFPYVSMVAINQIIMTKRVLEIARKKLDKVNSNRNYVSSSCKEY